MFQAILVVDRKEIYKKNHFGTIRVKKFCNFTVNGLLNSFIEFLIKLFRIYVLHNTYSFLLP